MMSGPHQRIRTLRLADRTERGRSRGCSSGPHLPVVLAGFRTCLLADEVGQVLRTLEAGAAHLASKINPLIIRGVVAGQRRGLASHGQKSVLDQLWRTVDPEGGRSRGGCCLLY